MKEIPSISEAELQVMKIIWAHHPISTNGVVEKISNSCTWSPKTVQTLLSRLVKKGALEYEKDSRVFVYKPLVDETAFLDYESSTFLKKFYNGTLSNMVVNFLEQDKLSNDDIQTLKKILNEVKAGEE